MKLLSLFDGIGCFPIAWANINNIKYENLEYDSSEIIPFLKDVISHNFPKSNQLNNVCDLDLSKLEADIITMGTPCPGFSLSGKGDGLENEESQLFHIGVDVINKVRPKYFFWENVFGVFSSNKGMDYREILDKFKDIGYDISWTLLDTKFFDLPQRRRRVYVIGVRDGINPENSIFDLAKRQLPELIAESKNTDSFFINDFKPTSTTPKEHYAFFNRQRSDKFKEIGISNTIAKRDFKGSTDVVIKNGSIRRITPKERLRLQGIPEYWFDSTYKKYKSDTQRFKANGMSVPVVEYVFKQLLKIEDGSCYNVPKEESDFKHEKFESTTSKNIFKNKKGEHKNISYSGQMLLDRDENGNVTSDLAIYKLAKNCAESSPNIMLKKVDSILSDTVEDKFHLSKGSLEGYLKREVRSGNELPSKMKEVILNKYPELIDFYNNLKKTKERGS